MDKTTGYLCSLSGSPQITPAWAGSLVLTAGQAASLAMALQEDARDYFYSACLTFVDATGRIGDGMHTWATVKLYYATYLACRSLLALNGNGIVFASGPYYSIEARHLSTPTDTTKRNTHSAVLLRFHAVFGGHRFTTQRIEGKLPANWIKDRREDSNYRRPRYVEPGVPLHFGQVERFGLRRLLGTYAADTSDVYTFDKDHAIVAFPLALILYAGQQLAASSYVGFSGDEIAFLIKRCCDRTGPFPTVAAAFTQMT